MALDQYRLQPLPPRRKAIWKILTFGVVAILLISMFVFARMNPRILCEVTGGKWIPYPQWVGQNGYAYVDTFRELPEEQKEFFGKCFP